MLTISARSTKPDIDSELYAVPPLPKAWHAVLVGHLTRLQIALAETPLCMLYLLAYVQGIIGYGHRLESINPFQVFNKMFAGICGIANWRKQTVIRHVLKRNCPKSRCELLHIPDLIVVHGLSGTKCLNVTGRPHSDGLASGFSHGDQVYIDVGLPGKFLPLTSGCEAFCSKDRAHRKHCLGPCGLDLRLERAKPYPFAIHGISPVYWSQA